MVYRVQNAPYMAMKNETTTQRLRRSHAQSGQRTAREEINIS